MGNTTTQKNVSPAVAIVVILLAIGVIGLIGWYVFMSPSKQNPTQVPAAQTHEKPGFMKGLHGGVGLKGMKGKPGVK